MTSVEPRAFMAHASASDSGAAEPAELAADERAGEFADAGNDNEAGGQQQRLGSRKMVRSALSPASPKNTGMNNAAIRPRNCSSMWRVRIGDSPIRTPATKAPSTVCTPIR